MFFPHIEQMLKKPHLKFLYQTIFTNIQIFFSFSFSLFLSTMLWIPSIGHQIHPGKEKIAVARERKVPRIKNENKAHIFVHGYRYVIASQSPSTIYLKCANFRSKCSARASKRKDTNETFVTKSLHSSSCQRIHTTTTYPEFAKEETIPWMFSLAKCTA